MKLSHLKPAAGSRPKRVRIGRGHGSGLVKTAGKGGKGQTARSGGGKGATFEGGQTPWFRRLPQRKGVSQKSRSTVIFRTTYTIVNLADLADWDAKTVVTPDALREAGLIDKPRDGVKILGGGDAPSKLRFKDVVFSGPARAKLEAAGATFEE
ncbi:MAG: 50S ribosomal protein L15 [Candidatus Eremiobacteraeota bacterium]|nr:50S ribosomal protein L15 [Candidatus Eremiobacteraeota bacterium]MBV8365932.1 50S ribosomal protein L15 [Candidatus Eremiobacteraeota bacterium]